MRVPVKHIIDLSKAQNKARICAKVHNVYILDIGTGTFVLTFYFLENVLLPLTFANTELSDGMNLGGEEGWPIVRLCITNTAQADKSLTLIVEQEVE